MDRRTLDLIYSDREINRLRMKSEDLINDIENMTDEEYMIESVRLKAAIDEKIAELYEKHKTTKQ